MSLLHYYVDNVCICLYSAFSIGGEKDEEGNNITPKWHEFLLHFLTFFWKVVGACIPPT